LFEIRGKLKASEFYRRGLGSSVSERGPVSSSCEHDNEASSSTKAGGIFTVRLTKALCSMEILGYLVDYKVSHEYATR